MPDNTEGQSIFSLNLFNHAQRVAKMLSESALIPKEFQKNIPNTMIALEMANRVGASPLMVMQNLYVVYGKPSWSSKFVIASINTCGRFAPLRMDMRGDIGKENRACIAWTVEKSISIPMGVRNLEEAKAAGLPVLEGPEVSWKMAVDEGWVGKNGSKWKTMPELMFKYRAASFFGNLYCPEVLMGMRSVEETIDIGHEEPRIQALPPVPEVTHEMLTQLIGEKMGDLNKSEFDDANRIVNNKEESSYQKLYKLLIEKKSDTENS